MNILLTCAGRRNYLIEYFKAIRGVRVIACDASLYAPALYEADEYFIVPEVYDDDYISALLEESRKRKVDAIIPLNDLELPVLSSNKEIFEREGVRVLVAGREIIDLCFDKFRTVSFSEKIGLDTIPTFFNPDEALQYKKVEPGCSFIIKPRWGTASLGLDFPRNDNELISQYEILKERLKDSFLDRYNSIDYDHCMLIQRKITGKEYGMDVINDLKGNYKASFIRWKIAMRSGETDKAIMIHENKLKEVGERIARYLKHIVIADCDILIEDGRIFLLEINPRFGGGYPFSHMAGANLPLAIIEWLKGNDPPDSCFSYEENFTSAKVDKLVRMEVSDNHRNSTYNN